MTVPHVPTINIPLVPLFNVPETFGRALSYEGQIHALCTRFGEITDSYNDTIDYINSNFPWKFADPIEWSNDRVYEPYTVVYDTDTSSSFVSLKEVPVETPLTNTEYWAKTADYNAQVQDVQNRLPGYARCFETVADMQVADDLISGMICHTNGYTTSGDGNDAWYEVKSTGIADGTTVIELANSLYAHRKIYHKPITNAEIDAITES